MTSGRSWPVAWMTCPAVGRGVLFVFLALVPIAFSTSTLENFEYPKAIGLRLAALCLLAPALVGAGERGRSFSIRDVGRRLTDAMRRDLLSLGAIALALSAALSTACSLNPRLSWWGEHTSYAGLVTLLSYAVLYFAARALADSVATMRLLLSASLLAAWIATIMACLQFAGIEPVGWTFPSHAGAFLRPFGTLGHPNHLGALLATLAPIVLSGALLDQPRGLRWGRLILGIVLLVGMLLTMSRAAWLGGAAGFALLLGRDGWSRRKTALAGSLLAAALLVAWWNPHNIVPGWTDRLLNGQSGQTRLIIWEQALAIWVDHPALGVGPDAFQLAFAPRRPAAFWDHEWDATPTHPHNEVLHLLATQGLLGAAALVIVLTGLVQAAVRVCRHDHVQVRQLGLGLSAAVLAFLVLSLFTFTAVGYGPVLVVVAAFLSRLDSVPLESNNERWFRPALTLSALAILAILLWECSQGLTRASADFWITLAVVGAALVAAVGLLLRGRRSIPIEASVDRCRGIGWWRGLTLAGVGAAVLVLVVFPWRAHLACARGERLLVADPVAARGELERAVALDPSWEHAWIKLAHLHQHVAATTEDADRRQAALRRARAIWDRLIEGNPLRGAHHVNRGHCLVLMCKDDLARPAEAYAAFDAALERDPGNPIYYADAANAALRLGDAARARRYADAGLRCNRRYGPLLGQLGYLKLQAGEDAEACEHLEQAIDLRWEDSHWAWKDAALVNLIVAHHRLGNHARVEALATPHLCKHPASHEVRTLLEEARSRSHRMTRHVVGSSTFRSPCREPHRFDPAGAGGRSRTGRPEPTRTGDAGPDARYRHAHGGVRRLVVHEQRPVSAGRGR